MNIVLIAPSGSIASALDQLGATKAEGNLSAICSVRADADVQTITVRPRLKRLAQDADALLRKSIAGRNLQRITPLDAGSRFAAAVRTNAEARNVLEHASLIVVLERDGILAGWQAARRWAKNDAPVVYGIAPAKAALSERR